MSGGSLLNKGLPYDAEIEYLESTGTQYIDTGIPLYSNMKIKMIFSVAAFVDASSLVGAFKDVSARKGMYGLSQFYYENEVYYAVYTYNTKTYLSVVSEINEFVDFEMQDNRYYANGNLVEVSKSDTFYAGGKCFVFWNGGAHGSLGLRKSKIKVSSFSLYNEQNEKLIDFIPVRVGNVGYMYDKVSKQLFGNAGTGDFVLGNDI